MDKADTGNLAQSGTSIRVITTVKTTIIVSIIVPVYNVEDKLKRCVESIRKQTYKDIEIILINDGSIDGSGSICDMYSKMDRRIHVYHQENKGVSAARNTGIENSGGVSVFCR